MPSYRGMALRTGALAATALGCNSIFGVEDLRVDHGGSAGIPSDGGGAAGGAGGPGAMGGSGGAGGSGGGGGPPAATCTEQGLLGCYLFDDDTSDGGPFGLDATATGASFGPGVTDGAIVLDPASLVSAPTALSWAVNEVTVELWVQPHDLPGSVSARFGLFDHDQRYGVYLYAAGITCWGTQVSLTGPPLPVDTWSHVACTIDATEMRVFVNGTLAATGPGPVTTPGASPLPIAIGSNAPTGDAFPGMIDSLRVFGLVRTAEEICATSGSPDCE